jgi:hypothetical protein
MGYFKDKKCETRVWTGFVWLRIKPVVNFSKKKKRGKIVPVLN